MIHAHSFPTTSIDGDLLRAVLYGYSVAKDIIGFCL